jgi:hypothetical protein
LTLGDIAGLAGVAMMLFAYGAAALGRLDPKSAPALIMNLIGAGLVLFSLSKAFNLAAFVMETCWGLVAAIGLARLVMKRNSKS